MRPIPVLLAAAIAAPAFAASVALHADLTGAAEAPGPGAPTGKGMATVTADTDKNQICYTLTAEGTDTPTAAHIHKAAAGAAGPVVVPFSAPAAGRAEGCVPVAADLLGAIVAAPADYYVNVHTAAFPRGAMRGQLGK